MSVAAGVVADGGVAAAAIDADPSMLNVVRAQYEHELADLRAQLRAANQQQQWPHQQQQQQQAPIAALVDAERKYPVAPAAVVPANANAAAAKRQDEVIPAGSFFVCLPCWST